MWLNYPTRFKWRGYWMDLTLFYSILLFYLYLWTQCTSALEVPYISFGFVSSETAVNFVI